MQWTTAIDRWTEHMIAAGSRPGTIDTRRYQIGRLAGEYPHCSPWTVTAADLIAWTSRQSWAPSTRRSYRSAMRAFWGWGEQAGHVDRSPAALLPRIRPARSAPRPTPENVFVEALAAGDDRLRLILSLAAWAGLRRAEIAGLRWDDVADTAITVHGKGDRVRTVPMHRELRPLLAAERRRREAGTSGIGWRYGADLDLYLFPGMRGGPMTPPALGKIVSRALAGTWTAHTLRHRFASRAIANGVDLLALRDLLGHTSLSTTQIYTLTPDGALEAAVEAI